MIYNKLNLINTTIVLLVLNACGNSNDKNIADTCETDYVILSQTIDKDADGITDQTTTYNYNEAGQLISVIDDNTSENISTFTYNDQGLIEQDIYYAYYGFDLVRDYTYDANGNKIIEEWTPIYNNNSISYLNSDGETIYISLENYELYFENHYTYSYDENNVLISTTTINNNGTYSTVTTYKYDHYGNTLEENHETHYNDSVSNSVTSYTYTYNTSGTPLTKKIDFEDDGVIDRSHTYNYNEYGYMTKEFIDHNGDGSDDYITDDYITTFEWGCI